MENANENHLSDVDVGAWNKMCATISDVRKNIKTPFFF